MTALELALTAALLCALSGVPALWAGMPLFTGRRVACIFITTGAACRLGCICKILLCNSRIETIQMAWRLPVGEMLFRLDQPVCLFPGPRPDRRVMRFALRLQLLLHTPENRGESWLTFYLGLADCGHDHAADCRPAASPY